MMILGTDNTGTVRLIGEGGNPAAIPNDWNGLAITAHVLTPEQEAAYNALPIARAGITFDGTTLTAIPIPPPSAAEIAEKARVDSLDVAIGADAVIAQLKAMDNAAFNAWWTANVTNLAQANAVLKVLARVMLRRVL